MRTQIDKLRDTLALAEAQLRITDLARPAEWDRTPDATIFFIGSHRLVSPNAVFNDLQEWLADIGLHSGHVELHGDEPGQTLHHPGQRRQGGGHA
eukprot:8148723-Pyramimonas_sp.AAC.1